MMGVLRWTSLAMAALKFVRAVAGAVSAAAPVIIIIIIFVVVVARFLFKIVFYAPPLKSALPPYRDTRSRCLQRIIRVGFRASGPCLKLFV